MSSRNIFNAILFFAIAFLFFSLVSIVIAFAVKGDQYYVPKGKSAQKKSDKDFVDEEKLLFLGTSKETISPYNIFDSANRVIDFTMPVATEGTESGPEVTVKDINFYLENPEKCYAMSDMQLIGTAMAIPEEESTITLSVGSSKGSGSGGGGGNSTIVLTMNDEFNGGTIVAGIRRNLVVFKTSSGIRCLGEDVGKEAQAPVVAPTPAVASEGGDGDLNVRSVGPNAYVVSRDELTKATSNLASLSSQARLVPARRENGFKIFSIKPNSLYKKIGLENGDIIQRINGIDLTSPDKALEAYQRLRNVNKISIDIVRRGKKESMEYTIE